MSELREMIERVAQPGRLVWIGLRPGRRGAIRMVDAVEIGADGLAGDHGRAGKRAVTPFQDEHLAAVGSFLGRAPLDPALLRRNLVVAGINLSAFRGRCLRIGTVELCVTGVCAPCSRMEEALGPGGYAALRGHGGWCAEVRHPGRIALGDPVQAA
ncbi:MOSC domain-containing protein [Litorisediminicola beolgyonensis]|uniref:MOSC domain-containing protein n=1 Tax=Litorisediminicola beolgyonensis TaxID=1173614 RepID=A0ABW3ZMM7_9RHOB